MIQWGVTNNVHVRRQIMETYADNIHPFRGKEIKMGHDACLERRIRCRPPRRRTPYGKAPQKSWVLVFQPLLNNQNSFRWEEPGSALLAIYGKQLANFVRHRSKWDMEMPSSDERENRMISSGSSQCSLSLSISNSHSLLVCLLLCGSFVRVTIFSSFV